MGYRNLRELLVDATKFPAAIEAMLPEAAPKISTRLVETAGMVPAQLPDFVVEIPALPEPPTIPIGGLGLRRRTMGVREIVTEKPAVAREGRTRFLY